MAFNKKELVNALKSVGSSGRCVRSRNIEYYDIVGDDRTVDRLMIHMKRAQTFYCEKVNDEMVAIYENGTDNGIAGITLLTSPLNGFLCYMVAYA